MKAARTQPPGPWAAAGKETLMSKTQTKKVDAPQSLDVRNPATGEIIGSVPQIDSKAAQAELARVRAAQARWAATPLARRTAILSRFGRLVGERSRELAELISAENGKTIQEAYEMEIVPVTYLTSYFSSNAERILAPQPIPLSLFKHKWSAVEFRPRGVVYVISPWNFPFTIPTGEIVMALIAGNTVIHKPASLTPLIALKTQQLLRDAGVPEDVYRVITCSGRVAFSLIGPDVDYVNFTGSTETGRQVAERCGRYLVPCSMELGGKDPAIILEDADLERAANAVVWGAFANSGQICASVERVYVPRSMHDRFVSKVVDKVRTLRQGNPATGEVDVGAMTDRGQIDIVHKQVQAARRAGAKVLTGGERPDGDGQFYPPTVLTHVTDDMDVVQQESFGPVLPILVYDRVDEVIDRANKSPYGLTASVFGKNERRAREIAGRLQAGTVMLNDVLYTHAMPETPWAGIKESGTGRVHSDEGLRDLCLRIHVNGNRLPTASRELTWYPYSNRVLKVLDKGARVLAEQGLARRLRRLARELLPG
jgi:acyl-CoA reductase-like NAD-dependent aldehyde dehydrogenase